MFFFLIGSLYFAVGSYNDNVISRDGEKYESDESFRAAISTSTNSASNNARVIKEITAAAIGGTETGTSTEIAGIETVNPINPNNPNNQINDSQSLNQDQKFSDVNKQL